MLEALLAYHCAPAFAGIKPSNIAACRKSKFPDLYKDIDRLNDELNRNDIYIEILCECEKRALLLVYRKKILEKHLKQQNNRAFLSMYGYPENGGISDYIDFLRTRLANDGFPHEIGVFLGYPLRDIYAFIKHRDEGCLLIGEWKVYHNATEAEKLFRRFKACRNALVKRVAAGRTLAEIFCAA